MFSFADLSYVEGPIVDPDRPSTIPQKPTKVDTVTEFSPQPQYPDSGSFFNHQFGGFFGPGIFGNPFGGFGLFDFPRFQPWWKG